MGSALNLLQETIWDPETGKWITKLTEVDALIYALIGFLVTFLGIILIIGIIWLAGLIIRKTSVKRKRIVDLIEHDGGTGAASAAEEVGQAERVAIIAAIAAYYEAENTAVSEFKVRRIKRL